jgi:imidazolonepropionase-like amidohydrolase
MKREVTRRREMARRTRVAVARLALAFAGACAPPGAARAPDGQPPATAIIDVAVVSTAGPGAVTPHQTVFIRNGRIAALGDTGAVRVPNDAVRIDGRGLHLMAGLADMHVHLEHTRDPEILSAFLASGVTTVRNMDGRAYILDWRDRITRGVLAGPRIYTAGPILDGDPPLRDDNTPVRDSVQARTLVRAQRAAGYDFVKVYTNLSPEAYRAVVREARVLGMDVAGHLPRRVAVAEAAEGQRTIEHLTDYAATIEAASSPFRGRFHWSKLYLGMPIDSARVAELATLLARHGVWTVPTLVERDRSLAPAESLTRWMRWPELARIPTAGVVQWEEQLKRAAARMDSADWRLVDDARRNRARLVAALFHGGAPLLIGTDTPNAFVLPGVSLHDELARFVGAGLTHAAALDIATRQAARFLDDRPAGGTVAVGARADLLVLRGNPLEDLRAARSPLRVMVGGRWVVGPP